MALECPQLSGGVRVPHLAPLCGHPCAVCWVRALTCLPWSQPVPLPEERACGLEPPSSGTGCFFLVVLKTQRPKKVAKWRNGVVGGWVHMVVSELCLPKSGAWRPWVCARAGGPLGLSPRTWGPRWLRCGAKVRPNAACPHAGRNLCLVLPPHTLAIHRHSGCVPAIPASLPRNAILSPPHPAKPQVAAAAAGPT